MNPILENKLIAEAKNFGFKPHQHGYDARYIKSRDQFRTWHIMYVKKYRLYLCDRYSKKKQGKILISELKTINGNDELETLYHGKVESVKFLRQILLSVGCSPK